MDELLVGIVAQVKLNPQRVINLTEKQRTNVCASLQQKYNRSADHMRRTNQRKSNMKKLLETTPLSGKKTNNGNSEKNKENIPRRAEDPNEESDDELSSEDEGGGAKEITKDVEIRLKQHRTIANSPLNRLLNYRRYGSAGFNQYFNNNNNNNNLSSSSCSTPTSTHNPTTSLTNPNNKRQSYDNSQPQTPKKSTNSLSATTTGDSDSNDRCINKLSNRTKLFLTSFLKFRKSLRVKRRNSNSCSDLFVI